MRDEILENCLGSEKGPSSEAPAWLFLLREEGQRQKSEVAGSSSEMRLGTSVMAGSPVPRVEDSGVVEWMDGDVIWLRYEG